MNVLCDKWILNNMIQRTEQSKLVKLFVFGQ